MTPERSAIFTKNRFISKIVKQLLESLFSYCNTVFSIMNKVFIEKKWKRKQSVELIKYSRIGELEALFKI